MARPKLKLERGKF